MKSKDRKARFFLLLGVLLLGVTPMKSGNLYVYGTDGSKQTFSLDEVRKLTFSDTEMVINKKAGGTASILFTDLQFFTLRNITAPSTGKLFVYETDGTKQSFLLETVRKLTFSETAMQVNKKNGETASILFADLRCFSFYDNLYQSGTGTDALSVVTAAVNVYPNPVVNEVHFKNAENILGVSMYDMRGRKLLQLDSESSEISLSLGSYPAGIYLLQIVDKNGISIKKIIKN
jgi:hypothetical protein